MWFRKSERTESSARREPVWSSKSRKLTCSFCGKSKDEVEKLIAGPVAFICNECVDVCVDIIAQDAQNEKLRSGSTALDEPPTPPLRQLALTCTFCGKTTAQALAVEDRGVLCAECADAVEDALKRGRSLEEPEP